MKGPFSELSRSESLGEFRSILGAALGIGNSILGIRNSILGMASHDLINTKPTILGATPGAIPGIAADPPERFSFAPAFSERVFRNWGGPRAPENWHRQYGLSAQFPAKEGPGGFIPNKPYSCLPNQQRGNPSWKQSARHS